jgi:hypothetical protein
MHEALCHRPPLLAVPLQILAGEYTGWDITADEQEFWYY